MYAFVLAYVLVWALFSLTATLAQHMLHELHVLTPMMEPATPTLAGGLLLAAGQSRPSLTATSVWRT